MRLPAGCVVLVNLLCCLFDILPQQAHIAFLDYNTVGVVPFTEGHVLTPCTPAGKSLSPRRSPVLSIPVHGLDVRGCQESCSGTLSP